MFFCYNGSMSRINNKVMIIAEIGTSHDGNVERAHELIDAAVAAGADCVKTQIVYADEILHQDTGIVNLPGGPVRLYDRFRELEMPPAFFAELSDYCHTKGVEFMCSPFGIRSARELKKLNPAHIKIASPELNHFPLLRETASYGVPLILSSGVSRITDIEKALEATVMAPERILLHCITSYPAPEEEYNLNVLESLSSIFGIKVGVSDHSLDPELVPVLALACGACVIEKHITLSRSDPGLDDPVALTPDLFALMVKAIRNFEGKNKADIVSAMGKKFGDGRITKILGSGKKELAESERANYTRTNRSLHYMRNIESGKKITPDDISVLRTEKILTPGISPEYFDTMLGAVLSRDVKNGAGVQWEDVITRSSPLSI